MSSVSSYGKIYNLGHPAVRDLFLDPVVIQEKVDGSQFSFGMIDGELCCRSKNRQINIEAPDNLFVNAVAQAKRMKDELVDGWTYRAEYLRSPGHNHLRYDRVPEGNLALFDVDTGTQEYLGPLEVEDLAEVLGIDAVPHFDATKVGSQEELDSHLDRESFLGGPKIEGVVIKNYHRFGRDGKALMAKYVSEAYRETAKVSWKDKNPSPLEIRQRIADNLRSERRWEKVVEHARDDGTLTSTPQDIGPLIKALQKDLREECEELIKDMLYGWAEKEIYRQAMRGFPEWYKQRLVDQQFGAEA